MLMKEEEGVDNIMVVAGVSMIGGTGENVALGFITLKPWNERKGDELYSTNILNRIRAKVANLPEAEVQLFEPPAIMGLGMSGGMDYRLLSTDTDNPQKIEAALQNMLLQVMGFLHAVWCPTLRYWRGGKSGIPDENR